MNHNLLNLNNVLIFAAGLVIGAAVGVVASKKILEKKYIQEVKDELAAMKEDILDEFTNEPEPEIPDNYVERMNYLNREFDKARNLVRSEGYEAYEDLYPIDDEDVKPQVIPPDEVGDIDEYEIETLFYTEDKVLTDETGEPIEDIEKTVGLKSLDTFGDYEDDSVYVRNDRLRTYFEILLDPRTQSEIMGDK